jgi:Ala-tRNA(Pro) deacylase
MALTSLVDYLDRNAVRYTVIAHLPAYTAQGVAALTHISGRGLAKTVMVKLNGKLVMAVLPAMSHVNLGRLKRETNSMSAELASEAEFKDLFSECETGAMPPFGNLYGMEVFVDESLAEEKEIAFNAGSHRELIRLLWEDFEELANPKIISFASGGRAAEAA